MNRLHGFEFRVIATGRRINLLNVINVRNQDVTLAASAPDYYVAGHPPARLKQKMVRDRTSHIYEIGILVHARGFLPNPTTNVQLVKPPDVAQMVRV